MTICIVSLKTLAKRVELPSIPRVGESFVVGDYELPVANVVWEEGKPPVVRLRLEMSANAESVFRAAGFA